MDTVENTGRIELPGLQHDTVETPGARISVTAISAHVAAGTARLKVSPLNSRTTSISVMGLTSFRV